MILRSLKLENIRSYTTGMVEFPEHRTVLSGDIGSGKSTILLAIEFALFGLRSDVTGAQLLRHGEKQGSVELSMNLIPEPGRQVEVIIRRALRRTKDAVQQDAGWFAVNTGSGWVKTDATPVELKAKIFELLGYPPELLTKSKTFLYRFTVYTPQEQMKQILLGSSEERLDTIRKIFGIDAYKTITANAATVAREFRLRIRQETIRTEGIDADKKKHEEVQQKQHQFLLRRAVIEQEQAELAVQNAALQQREQELIQKQREAQQLIQQEAVCTAKEQGKKHEMHRGAEELKNQGEQQEKMRRLLPPDITPGIIQEEKKKSTADLMEKRRLQEDLEKQRTLLTTQRMTLVGKEQQLATMLETRQRALERLTQLHECPQCKQGVSEAHKQAIREQEMPLMAQTEHELKGVHDQKILQEHELSRVETEIQKLRLHEKEALQRAAEIVGIETTLLRLQDSGRQVAEKQQVLQQLEITIKELQNEQAHCKERMRAYEGIIEQHAQVQKELGELRAQERRCAIAGAEVKKEIENCTAQLTQLEGDIARKEALRKKLHQLSQIQTWLGEHLTRIAGLIEKEVLRTVYVQFDELFRNWFSMLVEDDLLQARLADDFSVLAEQNGYETTIEHLSGGEKTAVALAYRLALNKVINDLVSQIRTKNLLILDEPTDGFSAHQLDRLRVVLRELNAQQVIMVSHEQKMESLVDHVIRIEKRGHESVIIR
ncbi:MAG: SMC family ATPase [Candidatus Woesearchaeota archaeon]|nr:SMC family ATPase [Candidatus Woesearchaeota archaeon]